MRESAPAAQKGPDPSAPDPRVVRSRTSVIVATRAILRESGFSGATIEAVSVRSGVAKTTIYRQWKDRNELLLDAFSFNMAMVIFPATHDLRADLCLGLNMLCRELYSSEWVGLMPAMIEASERDPEFLAMSRSLIDSRRKPLKDRLQLAFRRGELSDDTDIETLLAVLTGPLFYRRLVAHQPMKRTLVDDLVDLVLRGAA